MTEAFGIVASGISVASLVIQIVENLNKVINFCESIREAPTDIQRILTELHILSNIVSNIQLVHEKRSLPESSEATTKQCLGLVRDDISKLSSLSSDLERKVHSDKRLTRTWARVQTVLSEKKIAMLRGQLDGAKGTLQLLQSCYIFQDLRALSSLSSKTPKDLGYSWETGQLEDHVKVDDGLEKPFYLPIDLCSTPKDFINVLSVKYRSRKLPGLSQIQRGHVGAFNWSEDTYINDDNWDSMIKGGRGIKLAFIMSTWHGFPLGKCIRCYKPRGQNTSGRRYTKCSSCGLELRRVEPDAIPFEVTDVSEGLGSDEYRNYRVASRKRISAGTTRSIPERGPTAATTNGTTHDNPPIDFVCRRLIVKWEPVFNIVHRYLHCRCVIRLSTPSHIGKELTLLTFAECPRHNIGSVCHLDYGDTIDSHQDQYFERFGGYRSFQGMIHYFAPNIYESLGGEKLLPAEQVDEALKALDEFQKTNEEGFRKAFLEYAFEVNDMLERNGFPLPEQVEQAVRDERLRRRSAKVVKNEELGLHDFTDFNLIELQRSLRDSPMVRELHEILDGKWSGKPHWVIEDEE